uniref:Uncharacterized protein n=1 Tax=feces metagenome TaxID=1861841 RepID=A0A7M2QMD2_9ZZZZ
MQSLSKLAVTAFFVWMSTVVLTSFKPDTNMKASRYLGNLSTSYDCDQQVEDAQ